MRGETWDNGMMEDIFEKLSQRIMRKRSFVRVKPVIPMFQYSSIPVFHH